MLHILFVNFVVIYVTFVVCVCLYAGIDSPEDLCILYSNRAACNLKDGNSQDCIQDCTR